MKPAKPFTLPGRVLPLLPLLDLANSYSSFKTQLSGTFLKKFP